MTYSFFLTIVCWFVALSATPETTVSDPQFVGAVPRLTTDAAGNPLLSWVEKQSEKEAAFYFAVSTNGGQTFGPKIRVKAPADLSSHAEGMPKIAVKSDGTIVAVFEVPRPTAESRFAGDLLYTMSTDAGKTWQEAKPIHLDTTPGESHSFADITRLPTGEIGAVWLDDKLPNREGRSVVFAQTTKGKGFGAAVLVDDNACQCCRTNVFVDAQKRIHLTYRDLIPATRTGEIAARDISTAVSADGGKTFGKPQVVFADHWQVNACPHTGPVVAQSGSDILTTWFSGKEGEAGIRLFRAGSDRPVSSVLTSRARHPQVSAGHERLAWVWDESISKDGSNGMGSFVQRIGLRTVTGNEVSQTVYLTPETVDATYPCVLATEQGFLVAYEQKDSKQNTTIVARLIEAL